MEYMKDMRVEEFIGELASNSPAPGGGSASGLSASKAAALAAMVFNLTVGKKLYNEYDEWIREKIDSSLEKALKLKDEFLRLMDEDTEAFNKVMGAFKLPKDSEEEKKFRSGRIQEAYMGAMEVPLRLARMTMEFFEILEVAVNYGNPNAISDAGVGVYLAQTALEGALLNVRINLSSIKDGDVVKRTLDECRELSSLGRSKKESLIKIVESKL